jgi:hypothetical protein
LVPWPLHPESTQSAETPPAQIRIEFDQNHVILMLVLNGRHAKNEAFGDQNE